MHFELTQVTHIPVEVTPMPGLCRCSKTPSYMKLQVLPALQQIFPCPSHYTSISYHLTTSLSQPNFTKPQQYSFQSSFPTTPQLPDVQLHLSFVVVVQLLSRAQLFATSWTVTCHFICPWDFPGIYNTAVGSHLLFQGIFPIQGSNPVSCIAGRFFTIWATSEALKMSF